MGVSRNWFNVVRRKFITKSQRDITILHSPSPSQEAIIITKFPEAAVNSDEDISSASSTIPKKEFSKEDIAAVKIQAVFRGHLARRAFRALKSLVKLQAVVRGASVRRQSRIAMQCMHALVRLHVRVRARQILSEPSDG
ncbi:hypothetical protein ACOSP7_022578 [Xanthoceras sorbifolium]|uniref:Uncharacterized protein n=1 Tax=Xanthoceras sorbifolium TaxID=99658 RepID=A0ABQ8HPE1_9ROSI|nr:hypothetical protein JRO89_XS08G0115800 [Xanthoceras sorbifolium]